MALDFTADDIKRYVRRMLGDPTIMVEINDATIDEVIEQALKKFGRYKPAEKVGSISVLANQQKYSLTKDQVGKGILEIFRPDLLRQPVSLDQFDVFSYHTFTPNLDPGDYYLERMWWKAVRVSAGSDDDIYVDFDPDTGTATVYVNPIPSEAYTLRYIYLVNPTLIQVPESDEDAIKDYVLALCKIIVGEIRSKFKGVDGAEGAINMNGEELKAEGKEEKMAIEDNWANRGQVVPPLRG
jgi:hypothetical protein